MNRKEDTYYIKQVLSGNISQYKVLVEKHQKNVYNIVCRMVHQNEDAEELAQDVFLKAYEMLGTFKAKAKFSTWLYRIAYNMAVSYHRKKKVVQLPVNEEILEMESDVAFFDEIDNLGKWEQHLPDGLLQLSNEERTIIFMYYNQGLTTGDIAAITGISKSNVKIKLYRSRKQLFDYISNKISSFQNSAI